MSEEITERVFTYPAAVVISPDLRTAAVERRVFDEAKLAEYNPFFFSAEISNNRLDSHSTRMAVSTLKNYAAEAQAGVAFLYSHDRAEIVGRSMGGQFVNAQGNGVARVVADFYAIPNLQLGAVSSDQVIRAIDSGVLTDVSVGFYGGEWICSICGHDIWDWEECGHYPGMTFKIVGNGETREEVCVADVENAHLAEASGVYKGSTPGAMIAKANREALDGRMKPETRAYLERHLRIHLPDKRVVAPGHTQESNMPENTKTPEEIERERAERAETPELLVSVRALVKDAGLSDDFATIPEGVRLMGEELKRLRPLADDGATYRNDLVEEALAEGVRAHGAEFAKETYRAVLNTSTLETVKRMRDDWKAVAGQTFQPGRQTADEGGEPETRTQQPIPPAYQAAYSAS